jgi:UDP-glucose 4-epimerase
VNVLITGSAGFIGSHLFDRLRENEHRVYGIDNLETGHEQYLRSPGRVDVTHRVFLYEVANFCEPELVIHCAASYKDPNAWHHDTDTNVAGTINAINVARHHGAKLVYFQTALPPISSYAISKIAAENYIKISGLPYLIFRLSNIYGSRNISGPIPAFYKRLAAGEECRVVQTVRDMVYIDDLVDCVMAAIEKNRVGVYDVCSGVLTPISELYYAVARHFPDAPEPEMVFPEQDDVMPKTSVHEWLTGWRPKTKLQDGIDQAVRWYSDNGVEQTFTHLKVGA